MGGIALLTLAVFWQVNAFDFINYDDNQYVYKNPDIQDGLTLKSLLWAFTTSHASNWHPLTWISHIIDWQLLGAWAGGHHLTSVFLHIANSLLLYWVLQTMTGSIWRSGLVAFLFALHPLHVQSVVWVAERKDVLSAFFFMLSLWAYGVYVRRQKWAEYIWVVVFFILGLMSKPMVVTLPFVLLLLDFWPLKRIHQNNSGFILLRLIAEKIPLLILSAVSSNITFIIQNHSGTVKSLDRIPLIDRVTNILTSYLAYILKTIYPSKLSIYYPFPQEFPWWEIGLAVLAITLISITVLHLAHRSPHLIVGWLWFLGMLVPVIGLVQVGTQSMADRYTYLPLIGIFIMIAWTIPEPHGYRQKQFICAGIGIVLLSLSFITWMQIRYWKNTLTLFTHAMHVTSRNIVAHDILGGTLLLQGQTDEALFHFNEILKINPAHANSIYNLGVAMTNKGLTALAIEKFRQTLMLEPDHAQARNNLANALLQQGKINEAIRHFQVILQNQPNHVEANINMGTALARLGRIDEAIAHYETAIQNDPANPEAYNNMGVVLARKNRLGEAGACFRKALALRPGYESAANNLRRLNELQP